MSVNREERFCIVTRIRIHGNDNATKEGFQTRGINSPKAHLLQALADEFTEQPARVSLQSAKPANASFRIKSGDGELEFEAVKGRESISGRREGVPSCSTWAPFLARSCRHRAQSAKAAETEPHARGPSWRHASAHSGRGEWLAQKPGMAAASP